jgi:hypothetical protein
MRLLLLFSGGAPGGGFRLSGASGLSGGGAWHLWCDGCFGRASLAGL